MDDFSIFGDSFESCLTHLGVVLDHCEKKASLIQNKCYFIMIKGIILGHIVPSKDKAKAEFVSKISIPNKI